MSRSYITYPVYQWGYKILTPICRLCQIMYLAPEVIIDQGDESDDEIEEVDLVNTDIFSKYPNFN